MSDKKEKTHPIAVFIFSALFGFTLGVLPGFVSFMQVQGYQQMFPDYNRKESKLLVQCDDGSTEWQPLPRCDTPAPQGATDED